MNAVILTSFFTTSLSLRKPKGLASYFWVSNLSTSDFTLAKLAFFANFDVSVPVV